jgi:hypothetical protein
MSVIAPEEVGSSLINSYSSLVTSVWASEEEAARLAEDPTAFARAKGLPVEVGAVVHVESTPREGLVSRDEVIAGWTGTPGVHTLYVPATPIINPDELQDADLDGPNALTNVNIFLLAAS